jgi:hypothetical protein
MPGECGTPACVPEHSPNAKLLTMASSKDGVLSASGVRKMARLATMQKTGVPVQDERRAVW